MIQDFIPREISGSSGLISPEIFPNKKAIFENLHQININGNQSAKSDFWLPDLGALETLFVVCDNEASGKVPKGNIHYEGTTLRGERLALHTRVHHPPSMKTHPSM